MLTDGEKIDHYINIVDKYLKLHLLMTEFKECNKQIKLNPNVSTYELYKDVFASDYFIEHYGNISKVEANNISFDMKKIINEIYNEYKKAYFELFYEFINTINKAKNAKGVGEYSDYIGTSQDVNYRFLSNTNENKSTLNNKKFFSSMLL